MLLQDQIQSIPFKKWIWQNQENRILLILCIAAVLVQFIWFKNLYPYPNFLPDSYSYLEAAFLNKDINIWPIGYSKFLRLFSSFAYSDSALIFFQYIFFQASMIYFLFTIVYLASPPKYVTYILFIGNVFNPLLLQVSNFISSDALFAALSLIWFTQVLWILYQPTTQMLATHSVMLLLTFSVRYNALYYPIISVLVIIFTSMKLGHKIAGITMICITIGAFSINTIHKYQENTSTTQFSAFGGWQLASNALFAYSHIRDLQQQVPAEFKQLHAITNSHMDSLSKVQHRPDTTLGTYYQWDEQAPLKKYITEKYRKDSISDGFKKWASVAPLYSKYGIYLIKEYPSSFVKHFILPNMVNYYIPDAEFIATYNMGRDTVDAIAKTWFHYNTNKINSSAKDKRISISEYLPIVLAIINLIFLLSYIGFTFLDGFKKISLYSKKVLWCMLLILICNFVFSVMASPIALRYQVFPMIISFTFMVILVSFIIQESQMQSSQQYENKPVGKEISDIPSDALVSIQ